MNKLCCTLNTNFSCKGCDEQWCEECWFDTVPIDTSHTNSLNEGSWGDCPKVGKRMRWSDRGEDGDSLQYIEARNE